MGPPVGSDEAQFLFPTARFNAAAGDDRRRPAAADLGLTNKTQLQWGRRWIPTETRRVLRRLSLVDASMGPPVDTDGDDPLELALIDAWLASTGPTVDTDRDAQGLRARLARSAASMGPPANVDGDSRSPQMAWTASQLQWGRRRTSTETRPTRGRSSRPHGFNGAADERRRRR